MPWEQPSLVEIDMNAEIGAYQEDDPRDPEDPIAEAGDTDEE